MQTGLNILDTWFRRVWTEQDQTAISDMFSTDGSAAGLGSQLLIGPEQFKQFHTAMCDLISDIHISIDKYVENGVWSSALCSLHATTKEGKHVVITGSVFARIENGKIHEAYNHWDYMGLWAQLGLLPCNCFEQCLCGKRLCEQYEEAAN